MPAEVTSRWCRPARNRRGPARGRVDVDDREPLRAAAQEGVRDGRARSPGAHEHDVPAGRVVQFAAQRGLEPGGVGVVADGAVGGEEHGVDGAERRGERVDGVEVGQDELLAGVRHVERVEPEVAGPAQDLPDALGGDPPLGEVDGPVDVAQPQFRGLGHVQGRGERGADARAHEPHEVGAGTPHRGGDDRSSAVPASITAWDMAGLSLERLVGLLPCRSVEPALNGLTGTFRE